MSTKTLNIKKGDIVLILAGEDKGKKGKVLSAFPKTNRLIVEDVNIMTKHKKARSAQDTGGRMTSAGTIDYSNAQVICPACDKATRVAMKIDGDKKSRICKKCGASLERAREAKVKKDAKADKKEAKSDKKDAKKEAKKEKTK